MPEWDDYQEDIADFLRSQPGVTAETNVPVTGSHGTNNIDVVAKFWTLGQEVTWLIECKKWKTAVPKEKPQAFCRVVETMGADRGLLVAENGFQSGCYDVVKNTNVHLVTLKELKASVKATLDVVRITDFTVRIALAHHRYHQHSKAMRSEYDLRLSIWSSPTNYYSTGSVLQTAERVLKGATLREFPIDAETNGSKQIGPSTVVDTLGAIEWLDLNLGELEKRLDTAEREMVGQGDYNPIPNFSTNYWSGKP